MVGQILLWVLNMTGFPSFPFRSGFLNPNLKGKRGKAKCVTGVEYKPILYESLPLPLNFQKGIWLHIPERSLSKIKKTKKKKKPYPKIKAKIDLWYQNGWVVSQRSPVR